LNFALAVVKQPDKLKFEAMVWFMQIAVGFWRLRWGKEIEDNCRRILGVAWRYATPFCF
jgi:hypothetical protein